MLGDKSAKNYDERRLRNLLALLFIALVVPTAVIIWQAFGQLKWEAFYQHRAEAEALANRIDNTVEERIAIAETRSFADFSFLNVTPIAKVLQRSPLSAYPVVEDLPGVIGYFQVDEDGAFSTPLLPEDGTSYTEVGLDAAEVEQRLAVSQQIRKILAENQLISERVPNGGRLSFANAPIDRPAEIDVVSPAASESLEALNSVVKDEFADADTTLRSELGDTLERQLTEQDQPYSQDRFGQLNQAPAPATAAKIGNDGLVVEEKRDNSRGRIQDLKLNEDLQKKSVALNRELPEFEAEQSRATEPERTRRKEQIALPQSVAVGPELLGESPDSNDIAITTFAGEIDPYEFSMLDSGHLVVFRNVWRNSERFIQGLLIDQDVFSENIVAAAFRETTLANMSDLFVGYHDEIISVIRGAGSRDYLSSTRELEGTLLYRRPLSAPFDSLELVFSIKQLPRGPGGGVLAWSTIVISFVFLAGFYALFRLGRSQIRLARQQQDFVSAVSHELKTPLTSIRMYGEMLKEGWADEAKQKQYYEYIHDESERLTRLISNVLQLAKITRSDPDFDLRPITVGELINQIESKISNQVERAGFELQIRGDDDDNKSRVHVDVDCFTQVVINLVDNAIKFSRDADTKEIHIAARLTNDRRVTFSVRDFGPGIPKDQLKKIFQLFYRTESELTRETVGTGIGLAIVHQLVTAMNGRVDVINQQPGAQFDVSFPTS